MTPEKEDFIKTHFIPSLKTISSESKPVWGKMTLQQMIEHFADTMRVANGRAAVKIIITPEQNLQKMQDFIMSEKPFRENTLNALMPEIPAPVRNKTVEAALKELEAEIRFFFSVFQNNKLQTSRNPFFGDLNFEQNVHLLYKHAVHHLRQFSVEV
ncbi:MAG: hypothetical protein ABIN57_06520 [Chitinophagaceae bacterium]